MAIKPGGGGGGGGGGATSGDDTLVGTSTNNTISGLGGNDTISGLGGNDTLAGNAGGDTIDGGDGSDTLYSGDISPAWSYPNYGAPYTPPLLDTGTDADTLKGGAGDDKLFAGYGDNVDGGDGIDTLFVSFQGATAGISFDINLATQLIGGGTITGVESVSWVQGSNYNDYVNLDTGGVSYGNFGVVFGMGGDDTLIAGYLTTLIDGGDGNDTLDGSASQYLQEIDGGAGDDTIYATTVGWNTANGGDGNDIIYSNSYAHGGAGNDTIYLEYGYYGLTATGDGGDDTINGSLTVDKIWGNDGNDKLRGGSGDDIIDGGAGADVISGDGGNDTLTGGADNDQFLFGQGDGQDTVTDLSSGDTVKISGYDSAQSITQSGSDVVLVLSSDDQITFQNATVAAVQAAVQYMPSTDDTLVGGPGDDLLRGYGGNDTISGNDGNDTLSGGAGSDTLDGGNGYDTLYSGDVSPNYTYPYPGSPYTPPLLDRGAQVDTLSGGAGDDRIFAGYGDNIDGGDGSDSLYISFQGAASGVSFDMNLATQVIGGGTITGVENAEWVEGSNYDDSIVLGSQYYSANGYEQVAFGMGGNDTLVAGYNTYSLDGGDGDDVVDGRNSQYLQFIQGGAGNDTLYLGTSGTAFGGTGDDTIYSRGVTHGDDGNDTIILSSNYGFGAVAYGDAGNDQVTGSELGDYIEGDDGNDVLSGGAGDDTMDAGAGSDAITGGLGNDTLSGGADNDTFVFGQGDGKDVITDFVAGDKVQINGYTAVQSILQSGSDVLVIFSSADQITLQNTNVATVQAGLQFLSSTNETLVGGPGDDYLNGYGGNDTISGNDGNDTLAGGSGADTIDGGAGDDRIYSGDLALPPWDLSNPPVLDRGTEVDTITGGSGDDTIFAGYGDNVDGGANGYLGDTLYVSFQGASSGVTFDGHLTTQAIGGGTITGIENIGWVEGSNYDDTIDARTNSGVYNVSGQVYGMAGNDTLIGGANTTFLDGGDGNDIVDARNSLYVDAVNGGAGDDTIYTAANTQGSYSWVPVIVNGGDGNDTITADGEIHGGAGDDTINVLDSANSGPVTGDDGNDTITGSGNADKVDGGAGNDTINGGAGDDLLTGGSGDDVLTGGTGKDQFIVGVGNDTITDFSVGDTLEIRAGFSAQSISQFGNDVVIALDNGGQLTFKSSDVASVESALRQVHVNDMAISADGATIYAAGDDGNLYSYNAATGNLINAWHVGSELGGMDISPDGKFAIVTDLQPVQTFADPNGGVNATYTKAVYKVDLETGAVTTFEYHSDDYTEYTFYDAAILNDGTVLLTEQVPPGWSAFPSTQILNLQTGAFTTAQVGTGSHTVLSDSSDGSSAIVLPEDSTDAPVFVYRAGVGVVASHEWYADNVFGPNIGVQAYNARAGLVAQGTGFELNIYNAQLQYQLDLIKLHPELSNAVVGLAFDPSGKFLFVLDNQTDSIVVLSTSDWSKLGEIAVGADVVGASGGFGDRLLVSPDMSYFTVQTDTGFVKVAMPTAGTDGDDFLFGRSGADTVDGGGGNDTIGGGAGADTLTGGAGNDTFLYNKADGSDTITDFAAGDTVKVSGYGSTQSITQVGSDVVVVFASGDQITFQNSDVATVQAGLHFDVQPPLNLTGTAAADTLAGGSGNDTLNGLGGNDILDGKAGADTMTGGAGNDTFYVDNAGDVVKELASQGTDTVHATISYTLATNVENGVLDGSSAINLTGNSVANQLTGNGGDNFLYGLGGNDTLKGGAGNDTLRGGLGTDTLTGGLGADIFQFEKGGGNDKVTDFVSGTDKLDFSLITGVTAADVKTALSNGNELIKVDVNHDGRADFTITLVGVTHVSASDYIFG